MQCCVNVQAPRIAHGVRAVCVRAVCEACAALPPFSLIPFFPSSLWGPLRVSLPQALKALAGRISCQALGVPSSPPFPRACARCYTYARVCGSPAEHLRSLSHVQARIAWALRRLCIRPCTEIAVSRHGHFIAFQDQMQYAYKKFCII